MAIAVPPTQAVNVLRAPPNPWRRWRVWARSLQILWIAWQFVRGWRDDARPRAGETPADRAQREVARARWLKDQFVELGPTFVKIGQALSTRVDLLPLTYVDEMAVLHDRIPAFPNALAHRFIEEELGQPPLRLYAEFSAEPIAAASLGQVYRARLFSGEEVAVKVQRPDLLEGFAVDLEALRLIARYIETRTNWLPGVELVDILDEFDQKLHEEVDYRREADNADRFRQNFVHFPGVAVAQIHRTYSSRRVLTMQFMHGVKVTDLDRLHAMGVSPPKLVRHAVNVNLKQLLEDGFYHADLHPGNILVDQEARLIFLDFGLVGTIPPDMRRQMIEAFMHIVDRDVDALTDDLYTLGFIRPGQDAGPLKPTIAWIIESSQAPLAHRPTFKELTDPMADLFFRFRLRVPSGFSFIIRTLIALEGIGLQLDPYFHSFDVAIPYAAKLLLSEGGRDLRNQLMDKLFTDTGLNWARLFELLELAKRDPGFKLAEVAEMAVEWLVSQDGAEARDRLADALLGDPAVPWAHLESLLTVAQQDPSIDLIALGAPIVNYFLTPESSSIRRRLARKIQRDLFSGRIGEWAGIYRLLRGIL